jgi:hypothetical protein
MVVFATTSRGQDRGGFLQVADHVAREGSQEVSMITFMDGYGPELTGRLLDFLDTATT